MAADAKQFFLEEVETPVGRAGDALRCLLHTLVFCRELGPVEPTECTVPLLDVVYAKCGDAAVERAVEDRVAAAVQDLARRGPAARKCQVVLTFFKPATRSGIFWSSTAKEPFEDWVITLKLVHHHHHQRHHSETTAAPPPPPSTAMAVATSSGIGGYETVMRAPETQRDREGFAASLRAALSGALALAAEHKAHIPPVQVPTIATAVATTTVTGSGGAGDTPSTAIGAAGGRYPFPFEVTFAEERGSVLGTLLGMIRSPHIL